MRSRSWLLLIALATTSAAAQSTPAGPALRLQSFSVIVRDYDDAKRWYVDKLGFAVIRDQPFGNGQRFVEVAPPGQKDFGIVLQIARTDPDPREPAMNTDYTGWLGKVVNVVLTSSNVTEYAASLKTRGVTLTSGPMPMPWGGQATFVDLYGNSFVVVGPLGK